jgi:hypothetical protein
MFDLEGRRILHQHAEQTAGEMLRRGLYTGVPEDLQAADLVSVDDGAKRASGLISSAIDEQ